MSRSYKKHGFSSFACYSSDKPSRKIYHKGERRKTKYLLKKVKQEVDIYEEPQLDWSYCKYCTMFNYCDVCDSYCNNYKNLAVDKIITKGIDYSLKYSDKWSWASDGGQYWTSDLSELRRRFDKEVFGSYYDKYLYDNAKNIWEEYVHFRNATHNKKHKVWKVFTNWKGEKSGYWICGPKQAHSDWNLMEFLWYRKLIPTTFWGPKDLVEWLTAHEEEILQKWFKMSLLRK